MDTSYLSQQVNNSIGQLHGLFDEIGVPGHEREARETEVCCHTDRPRFNEHDADDGGIIALCSSVSGPE